MTTPARSGFRMPAEWTDHERCWMAWPCRQEVWRGQIDAARGAYAKVART
ncbi:MAG: agmatine deiminase family protein, partial [Pseudomonadota bacterium]